MLRIDCGWCGAVIRSGPATAPCSHGICPACMQALREDTGRRVKRGARKAAATREAAGVRPFVKKAGK